MSKLSVLKKLIQEGRLAGGALLKEAKVPTQEKIIQKLKTPTGIEKFSPENQKIIEELKNTGKSTPEEISRLANEYISESGLPKMEIPAIKKVDREKGAKIAQAFEELQHNPDSPEVQKAYKALTDETLAQFKKLQKSGLKISKITPGQENPYKSSADLIKDVSENNHMWYYPTEQGFGSGEKTLKHPLLSKTGIKNGNEELLANDVFRIVHDYFGHVQGGNKFGAVGEENAWRAHMPMFTQDAQKALTTETRGQNSWVNWGPKGEANRANPAVTQYADQKAGILPDWAKVPAIAPIGAGLGSNPSEILGQPAQQLADMYQEYINKPVRGLAEKFGEAYAKTATPRIPLAPNPEAEAQTRETLKGTAQLGAEMALDPTNLFSPGLGLAVPLAAEYFASPEPEQNELDLRKNAVNKLRMP